jgi:hypothetical protein
VTDGPADGLPTASGGIPWRSLGLALAVVAALALAGTAIAGYLWLRSYTPIELAGTSGPAPASVEVKFVPYDEVTGKKTYVVSGDEDGRFGIYFDVANTGRLPITIEGLGGDEGGGDTLSPRTRLNNAGDDGTSRSSDFEPTTLGRGESTFLALEVLATNPCERYVYGSSIIWETVTLRYTYAAIFEREATLELPTAITLEC